MDAIALVVPAAALANPGSANVDAGALDTRSETGAADFAALLAAGLLPAQDPASLLPAASAQPLEEAPASEPAETLAPSDALALAGMASPAHPAVMPVRIEAAKQPGEAHGEPSSAAPHPAAGKALAGDVFAAPAAMLAAGAAAGEPGAAAHALPRAAEEPLPAPVESTALPVHPLHTAHAERIAPAQPTAVLEVPAPVQRPEFAEALSQQIVWMADKDAQVAELRINPPELGPVEVRLKLSGDEATLQFASAHAEVRNAIEAAVARLRESMAQAGISLGETSVSAESFREQAEQRSGAHDSRGGYRNERDESDAAWPRTPVASSVRRGLVDLFA